MPRRFLWFASVFLATLATASAGDGSHQVYVGKVSIGESSSAPRGGPERIALVYDDHRAPDGEKRKITVSMSYGDKTYEGSETTDADVVKVVLRNVDNPNDVLFKGTVEVTNPEPATLKIDGEYTTDDKKTHHIHASMDGYNLPAPRYSKDDKATR